MMSDEQTERRADGEMTVHGTRPQQGGEAGTTRFGMENGDNTDVPATGLDPEQQSSDLPPTADENKAEEEAEKLGDFA